MNQISLCLSTYKKLLYIVAYIKNNWSKNNFGQKLQIEAPFLIENTTHFIQVKYYIFTFYILQNEFSTCFHSQESCYYFFLFSSRKATPFQHLIRGMKGEWEAQQYGSGILK